MPFLKSKKDAPATGVMIKTRAPDESSESEDQDDPSAAHEACGQAIIDAIKSGSASAVASAMQDMFQMCELEPHEEGEHTNSPSPHSYDAQNQAAAKGNE